MEETQPIVTLTTDFGTADGYVGAMKGVILSICPRARLVDIAHDIPPQDLFHAAFTVYCAIPHFPRGTVHLVVVDPGVGSARRSLALQAGRMTYVAPDNGVLTLIVRAQAVEGAVALENTAYHRVGPISDTFHGRDIFAPAAAHLAAGVPLAELGPPVNDWVTLPFPTLAIRPPHDVAGEVLYLDRFGNAVTNIGVLRWKGAALQLRPLLGPSAPTRTLAGQMAVTCNRHTLSVHRTYSDAAPNASLALVGSSGLLEIAVRDGHAGHSLGIRPGDKVLLTAHDIKND